jgi:hypothetical protein
MPRKGNIVTKYRSVIASYRGKKEKRLEMGWRNL